MDVFCTEWSSGASLLYYIGFANPSVWGYTPLMEWHSVDEVTNAGMLPFLIYGSAYMDRVNCGYVGLARKLMCHEDGGIIGAWGITDIGYSGTLRLFCDETSVNILLPGRLGDRLLETYLVIQTSIENKYCVLFGDPAIYLKFHETGIEEFYGPEKPERLSLSAYPNPFNSAVRIIVDSRSESAERLSTLEIFDINGRMVAEISTDESESAKPLSTNASGACRWQPDEDIGSGVYLVRVKSGQEEAVKRVVYLK